MGTVFKSWADAALAYDLISARVDVLARDIRFATAREKLAPELAGILAGYNVTLPPVNESTGTLDPDALDVALGTHPPGHPHAMPAERQARLRRVLAEMGRL